MSKIQLLEMLTRNAREYRKDVEKSLTDNDHMHEHRGPAPSQEAIDALLVGFINYVGVMQGVDYALYAEDLRKEEQP